MGSGLGVLSPLIGAPVSALGGAVLGLLFGSAVIACEGALIGAVIAGAARLFNAVRRG